MSKNVNIKISADGSQAEKAIGGVSNSLDGLSKASTKSIVAGSALGTMIGSVLTKAFSLLSSEISGAVSRLDTLNNFPRVMQNLKISSEDADKSISILSERLKGLPTSLDEAARSVQRFTASNGNIKASTAMFLALNNAILAGGASAEIQANALEQMSQAYTKGKADAVEWRAMLQAMPAQMNQIAQAMGYTSAALGGDLQTALTNGEISMNDFMATIVRLNSEGVNGFASFSEQARSATNGVGTAITNLKLSIQRGLADIMNAIGQTNIAGFFNGIANAISTVTSYVVAFVKVVMMAINAIRALFGHKSNAKATSDNVQSASVSAGSLADNAQDATGALGGANKAAKALKNTLASFDEMNVLTEPQSSGGSGGGAGGGAGGMGDISGIDWSDIWGDWDTGKSKADEIAEKIKNAFTTAFDAISKTKAFSSLTNSVKKVGTALVNNWKSIFSNLKSIADTTLEAVGNTFTKYAGEYDVAFAHLFDGLGTFGEGLVNLLTTPFEAIASGFNAVWSEVAQTFTDSIAQIQIAELNFVGEMSNIFGNLANFISESIAPGFETLGGLMAQVMTDWYASEAEWLPVLLENFTAFFSQFTEGTLKPAVALVSSIWNGMMSALKSAWDKYGKDILSGIMEWVANIQAEFNKFYTEILEPIIKPFLQEFLKVWENTLQPALAKTIDFIAQLVKLALDFDNKFIAPIRRLMIDILKPTFVAVFTFIGNIVNTVFTLIGQQLSAFIDFCNGIINFLRNVFKGNWQGAWQSIKDVFGSIVSGLASMFKAPINAIIDGINAFLSGLNTIKIPDWVPGVGGRGFYFSPIPKLAKGGIVDGATTAIIGESGREAVLPLENNTEWIDELASRISGNQPTQIIVKLGEETIMDKLIEGINEQSMLSGRNAILV